MILDQIFILCLFLNLFAIVKSENIMSEEWAVHVEGGDQVASDVANRLDLDYLGPVGNLENIYHYRKPGSTSKRRKRSAEQHTVELNEHKSVRWVQQQVVLERSKRDYIRDLETQHTAVPEKIKNNVSKTKILSMFNDPKWKDQWYLHDLRETSLEPKSDMHIIPVWNMNITGRGIVVTVLDDGIEYDHPDLRANYEPKASYDMCDNDNDPSPDLSPGTSNEHGTRCASEIAMAANNNICGVGIAYNARVGGIRMLDESVNDVMEAKSLGFKSNFIDIYTASWGPFDNGKMLEGPGLLVQKTLYNGVTKGRNGKGNLFIWATGNGGTYNDSCGCDGYVSSIYTISITSISGDDKVPYFAENCASTIAATYSSTNRNGQNLITADVLGKCTNKHSGTSASAPIAAAMLALVLEANYNLTWRDVKHLIAWTTQVSNMMNIEGWQKNGAGFWVHPMVGFGVLDGKNMVINAQKWINVPEQSQCTVIVKVSNLISNSKSTSVILDGSNCSKINFIENVVLKASLSYSRRGALSIVLQSPNGNYNTTLLPPRILDSSKQGIQNFPFNSIRQWGETASGKWIVFVEDKQTETKSDKFRFGMLTNVQITFYGMTKTPEYINKLGNGKRKYHEDYNKVFNERVTLGCASQNGYSFEKHGMAWLTNVIWSQKNVNTVVLSHKKRSATHIIFKTFQKN